MVIPVMAIQIAKIRTRARKRSAKLATNGAVVNINNGNMVEKRAICEPLKPICKKCTFRNGTYKPTTPQYPK